MPAGHVTPKQNGGLHEIAHTSPTHIPPAKLQERNSHGVTAASLGGGGGGGGIASTVGGGGGGIVPASGVPGGCAASAGPGPGPGSASMSSPSAPLTPRGSNTQPA